MAAETAVSLVLETLSNLLIEKTVFLRGVEEVVEWMVMMLRRMQRCLKDAAKKQSDSDRIREWISEIREVAYDAEDTIEKFVLNVVERRGLLWRYACFTGHLSHLNNIRDEINSIRKRLEDIESRRLTHDIQALGESSRSRQQYLRVELRRRVPCWRQDRDVVGLERDAELLLYRAILERRGGLSVTLILGMGGIGKSTLAKMIYNHPRIAREFECRVWVVASTEFTAEDIMKQILVRLGTSLDRLESVDDKLRRRQYLEEELHRRLTGKRYFIVVDDVRELRHWESLSTSFPHQDKENRLLFTSRNQVMNGYNQIVHHMRPLDTNQSWRLFLNKASIDGYKCSEELRNIGEEIMKWCGGVPLAISVVGGLIGKKRDSQSYWEKVAKKMNTHLERNKDKDTISAILELSYHNLPPELKACIIFLGFFKEHAVIQAKDVVHIWVAQGLLRPKVIGEETMEDVATDYLNKLISRNILQIVDLTMAGRVKSFYLHGYLRDILLRSAKEELRSDTVTVMEGTSFEFSPQTRHGVVDGRNFKTLSLVNGNKYLRSLFLHNVNTVSRDFWKSCQLLKTLCLDGIQLSTFPDSLRALIMLKYLMIRRRKIRSKCALEVEDYLEPVKLPNWLDRLKYLEILNMEGEKVEFPNDVALKMKRLHYFSAYCVRGPMSINIWNNIQTLKYIRQEDWIKCCSTLSSSCDIHELGLFLDPLNNPEELREVKDSLVKMKKLEHLKLQWDPIIPIDPAEIVPKLDTLSKLKLRGKLSKCPDFLPGIFHLTLAFSDLSEDLFPQLSKLPELSYLKLLGNAYKPERIQGLSSDSLPRFRILTLKEMFHLKSIDIKEGYPRRDLKFRIQQCPSLQIANRSIDSSSNVYPEEYLSYSTVF